MVMIPQIFLACAHKSEITDSEKGEVLCGKCGEVLQDKIIDGYGEPMIHDSNGFLQNLGAGGFSTLTRHDMGLNTVINPKNTDSAGRKLSAKTAYEFNRLRIWDNRSKRKTLNRTMAKSFTILDAARKKLTLSHMLSERAAYLFRKAIDAKITRGHGSDEVIAAAIYAVCRETNTPRTLQEISKALNIHKKRIYQNYKLLMKTLEIQTEPPKPSDYLPKISSVLELSEKTKRYAYDLLEQLKINELMEGSKPTVVCAAAIYLSCVKNGEFESQRKIAEVAGISSVALRNTGFSLRRKLNDTS